MKCKISLMSYFLIVFVIFGFLCLTACADDENTVSTDADSLSADLSVPVPGVTVYKNGPSGYSLHQPDELVATVSEYAGHDVVMFLSDNQSVLTIDAMKSNLTLDELISDQKSKIETKDNYQLISEGETTLSGEPAYSIEFKYTDEIGTEKTVDQIMCVNRDFEYIIQEDKTSGDEAIALMAGDMISSFEFVPIEEDTISKMIKSKMKQMQAPDKGYRRSSYSYTSYQYYSWDYYYDWCYCSTSYINYYCWCW